MSQPASPATECADRPLRRDAERNRLRILQAAGELFTERGLGVTLDDIARHAGVGVGTVYRRFADKEVLIDALFEQRIEAVCATAEESLAHADPWDGLVFFFERGLERQACDRGLKELLASSAHGREGVQHARARLARLVTEIFDRAKAAGVLRADAATEDAPLIQMMVGMIIDRTCDVAPELWRRYLGIVLDGLRPSREGVTPLPAPALDPQALTHVMQGRRARPRREAAPAPA
jgi:AcrR family transcriptional regulator